MKISLVKTLIIFLTLFMSSMSFGQTEGSDIPFVDLPPTNEFGKCYAKCKIPDVYNSVSRQVLVKEASSTMSKTAAVYETQSKTIIVKEGGTNYRVIPATYRTETESVMIVPESKVIKTISAKYSYESRQVLVQPARGAWVKKKKDPNCFSKNPDDCYIACYEEMPAKYRTERYQVLSEPARTREEIVPAKFTTVKKRVIATPARVEEIVVEAEYKTISTKVLVSPASASEVAVPAQYKTISEKVLVSEGGYTVWTEILCASQTSSTAIRNVQNALIKAGYNPGPADGIMGVQTQTALKQFQTDKGLPIGNLNLETLNALGVKY